MIIENYPLVTDDQKLSTIFIYINIIEKYSGIKSNFINYGDNKNKKKEVENIVETFKSSKYNQNKRNQYRQKDFSWSQYENI